MRTENSAEQFELCGMLYELQNFPMDSYSYQCISISIYPYYQTISSTRKILSFSTWWMVLHEGDANYMKTVEVSSQSTS